MFKVEAFKLKTDEPATAVESMIAMTTTNESPTYDYYFRRPDCWFAYARVQKQPPYSQTWENRDAGNVEDNIRLVRDQFETERRYGHLLYAIAPKLVQMVAEGELPVGRKLDVQAGEVDGCLTVLRTK